MDPTESARSPSGMTTHISRDGQSASTASIDPVNAPNDVRQAARTLGSSLPEPLPNSSRTSTTPNPGDAEYVSLLRRGREAIAASTGDRITARNLMFEIQQILAQTETTLRGQVRFHLIAETADDLVLPAFSYSLMFACSRMYPFSTAVIADLNNLLQTGREAAKT